MTAPTETTSIRRATAAGPSLAKKVQKIIAGRSFCSLATATRDGKPHIVGIMYKFVNGHLYFATGTSTKKARNIKDNPNVAIHISVRRYTVPVGPPDSLQFSGTAQILSREDPEIVSLLNAGKLKSITGFGVLKEPDLCFLKIKPSRTMHTYGIGVPLLQFLRDVANADRTVVLSERSATRKGGPS
jgi:general stress protein 26